MTPPPVLPPPEFVERDPAVITAEVIAQFEAATGRTLQPAQVERILIDILVYREVQVRLALEDAARQNLVAFARFPMLDFLGEIVGAVRLEAKPAETTLRFTLVALQPVNIVVPAGTRVRTTDGAVTFATNVELAIAAGTLSGDVAATAAVAGELGNGYAIGAVSVILDPVALVATASNLVASSGGAELEDDERYRERVASAHAKFSTAGSVEAYRYHALSVSSEIADVAITNPSMGVVRVYLLMKSGLPTAGDLAEVAAALNADRVRPLSDTVEVVAPVPVAYTIQATVRPLVGADPAVVMAAANLAAQAYAADRRAGLGRDVVPSQIIAALFVTGVYEVTLTLPAYTQIGPGEWANATAIVLTQGAAGGG